jgi:hypothetical protein
MLPLIGFGLANRCEPDPNGALRGKKVEGLLKIYLPVG